MYMTTRTYSLIHQFLLFVVSIFFSINFNDKLEINVINRCWSSLSVSAGCIYMLRCTRYRYCRCWLQISMSTSIIGNAVNVYMTLSRFGFHVPNRQKVLPRNFNDFQWFLCTSKTSLMHWTALGKNYSKLLENELVTLLHQ